MESIKVINEPTKKELEKYSKSQGLLEISKEANPDKIKQLCFLKEEDFEMLGDVFDKLLPEKERFYLETDEGVEVDYTNVCTQPECLNRDATFTDEEIKLFLKLKNALCIKLED